MTRFLTSLSALSAVAVIAGAAALWPVDTASAQVRSPYSTPLRDDRAQENAREGRMAGRDEVIRNVERGRPGRRIGMDFDGRNWVVLWEYPDGRVREIVVDGRSGQVLQERSR